MWIQGWAGEGPLVDPGLGRGGASDGSRVGQGRGLWWIQVGHTGDYSTSRVREGRKRGGSPAGSRVSLGSWVLEWVQCWEEGRLQQTRVWREVSSAEPGTFGDLREKTSSSSLRDAPTLSLDP